MQLNSKITLLVLCVTFEECVICTISMVIRIWYKTIKACKTRVLPSLVIQCYSAGSKGFGY